MIAEPPGTSFGRPGDPIRFGANRRPLRQAERSSFQREPVSSPRKRRKETTRSPVIVRTHARAALCAAALALVPAAAEADPGGVEAPDPNAPAPAPVARASLAPDGRTALAPAG